MSGLDYGAIVTVVFHFLSTPGRMGEKKIV